MLEKGWSDASIYFFPSIWHLKENHARKNRQLWVTTSFFDLPNLRKLLQGPSLGIEEYLCLELDICKQIDIYNIFWKEY